MTKLQNPKYFNVIDTEAKAYWLGFLYADGGVTERRLSINLKETDREHIERFQQAIGSTHKIYPTTKGTCARVDISSTELVRDLRRHGIMPNKTLTLMPPVGLDKNLEPAFIRGYWDGDGSIGFYGNYQQLQITAVGTEAMVRWIDDRLPAPSYVSVNGSLHRVRSTTKNAKKNLDYLYGDCYIALRRKLDLYVKAMNQ